MIGTFDFSLSGEPDFYSLLFIFVASIFVTGYIFFLRPSRFSNLIFLGFLLRLFLLFADYYHWFPILNSGADSSVFNRVAIENQLMVVKTGGYIGFLTEVYYLTDCSRLIAQYINVLFGMGVILLIQHCMSMLNVRSRSKTMVMCVLVLLPNLNIFSAILLREAWVEFFVALSVFYFIKWFLLGNGLNIFLVVGSVLTACYMHAGVLGLLVGYIVAFLTYNPRSKTVTFSRTTIISLILLFVISVFAMNYMKLFTGKFQNMESAEDLIEIANSTYGGRSDYLTWINVNSLWQTLVFAPLKMFYFLFSPLPTEWRGATDIIGFLIDGVIYLYLCYNIVLFKATNKLKSNLKKYLVTAITIVIFIFAYGTKNAGTAFRHRAKILPVIVLAFSLSSVKKRDRMCDIAVF